MYSRGRQTTLALFVHDGCLTPLDLPYCGIFTVIHASTTNIVLSTMTVLSKLSKWAITSGEYEDSGCLNEDVFRIYGDTINFHDITLVSLYQYVYDAVESSVCRF